MFKFLIKIFLIASLGFGAYFFFNQDQFFDLIDRSPQKEVLNIPEVGYQEVPEWDPNYIEPIEDVGAIQELPDEGEDVDEADQLEEIELPPEHDPIDLVDIEIPELVQVPAQFNLAVPFTPQAPHANWSLPYQEACEEASAYMVAEYYKGTPSGLIDADTADAEILEIVAFEKDFLGTHLDTTASETSLFIDSFYGYGAIVIENPSVGQIKAEIAAGRPVIVPAAGQQLGNPNFVGLGPLYHMFVIKGYTEDKFITNDPGTRNGESFVYDIQTIMDAMGDWNSGSPSTGAKRVLFTTIEAAAPLPI